MILLDMTNISCSSASFSMTNSTIFRDLYNYLISITFGINTVLGLPLNCYVLWLSLKEMIQGQSSKIFVFNAALAEVIFCFIFCFIIPQYFFGCVVCVLPGNFIGMILLQGRPLFLSCVCVERYIGVLHPVTFLKLKPMKYRLSISAAGWVLILIICAITTTGIISPYILLLPLLIFFFLVKLYSCLMVLKALLRPRPGCNCKQKNELRQDKLTAFLNILVLLVSASLIYGPILVSLVLYHILDLQTFLLSWAISLAFGVMLGFVLPVLHLKIISKLPFC